MRKVALPAVDTTLFQRLPLVARAYAGGEHLRVRARAGARQALHEQLIFVPLIDTPHQPGWSLTISTCNDLI